MSVDLSTTYLGLKLRNPLVISASPICTQLYSLQRLEDAGAAAAVMASVFQEQIESEGMRPHSPPPADSFSATELFNYRDMYEYNAGPDAALRHLEAAKRTLSIPVIASLNGTYPGEWIRTAKMMQEAGADALELNIYFLPTQCDQTADSIEQRYLDLVAAIRQMIAIPLAVKIGPFFSSLPNMAKKLTGAGADGLVLFNRFLQPDIDLDSLEVCPNLVLSSRDELRLPLRWIAILREQLPVSLAATSGIHFAEDALKLIFAGADVAMLASALIRNGPDHLRTMLMEMSWWMEHKHFNSIDQVKGSLCLHRCANPGAFERVNYMRAVTSLSTEGG